MIAKRATINWGNGIFGAPVRSRFRCGSLLVELNRGNNEVSLASKQLSTDEIHALDDDQPVSWTSWAVCTGTDGVKALPGLPGLPVLAKARPSFSVAPGVQTRVYLRVPVSVQIRLDDPGEELLAEYPSEALPRTVFGEPPSPEDCLELPCPIARSAATDLADSEVQCPVLIRNESREVLAVNQICLRLARLSVYRRGAALWTSETVVRYQGGPAPSRVSVKPGPPSEAPDARLLVPARESGLPESVVGRTFRSFLRWAEDRR